MTLLLYDEHRHLIVKVKFFLFMKTSKISVLALGESLFHKKRNDTFCDLPVPVLEDVGLRSSRKRQEVANINDTDETNVHIFGSSNLPVMDLGTKSPIEKENITTQWIYLMLLFHGVAS